MSTLISTLTPNLHVVHRININKNHQIKTVHLLVGINNFIVEGLVDIGTLMAVLAITVVRELRIMHLVFIIESYKTTSGVMMQTMGRIEGLHVKIGKTSYNMVFMVVDTVSYDVLLGLDFLIKIGVVVDVEQGLIQVRQGRGDNVHAFPLNMVNMLQLVPENMAPTLNLILGLT
jgi:hypothetical protein